jgi:hypothetical protein
MLYYHHVICITLCHIRYIHVILLSLFKIIVCLIDNMKNKIKIIRCDECIEVIQNPTKHQEICSNCVKNRLMNNNCKRHGGKLGKNCMFCKLESKF